jgi:hypothetical protein
LWPVLVNVNDVMSEIKFSAKILGLRFDGHVELLTGFGLLFWKPLQNIICRVLQYYFL